MFHQESSNHLPSDNRKKQQTGIKGLSGNDSIHRECFRCHKPIIFNEKIKGARTGRLIPLDINGTPHQCSFREAGSYGSNR